MTINTKIKRTRNREHWQEKGSPGSKQKAADKSFIPHIYQQRKKSTSITN
jgi:hypothetical protein